MKFMLTAGAVSAILLFASQSNAQEYPPPSVDDGGAYAPDGYAPDGYAPDGYAPDAGQDGLAYGDAANGDPEEPFDDQGDPGAGYDDQNGPDQGYADQGDPGAYADGSDDGPAFDPNVPADAYDPMYQAPPSDPGMYPPEPYMPEPPVMPPAPPEPGRPDIGYGPGSLEALHERGERLAAAIERSVQEGRMSSPEADQAYAALDVLAAEEDQATADGVFTADEFGRLNDRLDALEAEVR